MPGTEDGVDIYPGTAKPLDYPRHADRLKDNGTALRAGDEALVTKIKVKSKLIEFQLDGGGYGTMGDETSSNVSVGQAPKTKREQNLEAELKRTGDPVRRRQIKEELDDLKADRERENARNRANVAKAEESRKANIRERRLQGGSRFNIRFGNGVPQDVLTADGIKAALAAYVEFRARSPRSRRTRVCRWKPGRHRVRPRTGCRPRACWRPRSIGSWGKPSETTDRMEGRLKVTTKVYRASAGQVTAEFVEGVLIRYSMTSN